MERKRIATVVTSSIIVLALVSVMVLIVAAAPLNSPPTAGSTGRPFSGPDDPAFLRCLAPGAKVCDSAADAARRAANREAQSPATSPQHLSRQAVEAAARSGARTPLTPEAPANAPTYSALMTRQQFEAISGETRNESVDSGRRVWVMTVHAPMATSASRSTPSQVKDVYSVALDAETGQWTDACIGCAWLNASR